MRYGRQTGPRGPHSKTNMTDGTSLGGIDQRPNVGPSEIFYFRPCEFRRTLSHLVLSSDARPVSESYSMAFCKDPYLPETVL